MAYSFLKSAVEAVTRAIAAIFSPLAAVVHYANVDSADASPDAEHGCEDVPAARDHHVGLRLVVCDYADTNKR
jgi:hypothetical protein